MKVFTDHARPVYALSFSPDGRWVGTGSGDGWLHLYNVKVNFIPSFLHLILMQKLCRRKPRPGVGLQDPKSPAFSRSLGNNLAMSIESVSPLNDIKSA